MPRDNKKPVQSAPVPRANTHEHHDDQKPVVHSSSPEEDILSYSLRYRSQKSDAGVNVYLQLSPEKLSGEEGVLELDTSTTHVQRAEYASGNSTRFFIAKHVLDDDVASNLKCIKLNSKISLSVTLQDDSTDENWQVFNYQNKEPVLVGDSKNMNTETFFDILHNQYEITHKKPEPVESVEPVNTET